MSKDHSSFDVGCISLCPADAAEWLKEYQYACESVDNRKGKLSDMAEKIETNIDIVGVTAIEDRLQEGVPETIRDLLRAGRLDTETLRGCRQLLQNGAYCSCTPHGGDESNTVIVCNHKIEWPMGTPSEFLSFVREQLWWTKEVTEDNVDTLASSGQSLQQLTDKEIFDYLFGWERSRNGHNTNIEPGKAECLCFRGFNPSSGSLQVYKALGPMFLRYKNWRRRLVANKDFKKNVQKRKCFDALASWNRKLYTKEMDAHMVYHNQSDEEDEDEELPSKNFRLKLSVQKKSNDKDKNQQEKGEPTATSAAKECSSQNDDTKKKDPT